MQPGDFRGVTADPSKPLPTPAEPTPKPSLEAPAKPAAAARPKAPPPLGPQMAAPAALPAAAPVLATSEPTAKGEGDVPVKAGGQAAHEIASGETTEATAPAEPSEREFDTTSARAAIEEAGQRAAGCRTIDAPAGAARLAITFAPTGRVTSAVIDSGPFAGTPAGACVVSKFRTVQVPPFDGESVTVHKTIAF
ncbi:MAG TPA: hypothetical protein VJT73_01840, partial [Polyangiaceae bacterium]|nr:hypothetical protein [Polyangiaceae bacterium]